MGVLRRTQIYEAPEADKFCKTLLRRGGAFDGADRKSGEVGGRRVKDENDGVGDARMVCVTSGMSLVGSAIVNRLLSQGYCVRLTAQTQEDVEKVMDKEKFNDMRRDCVSAMVADVMNLDSLCRAFEGCSGIFHTSAFIDPSGVSGYTKYMADNEARAAELVIEACVRTESIRKCIFTSSLLACIWQQRNYTYLPTVVDERCWSDESLCRHKKLWYALGKTMAEKAAWKTARGRNLKLVTICPALVTGESNSIAYLKGAEEMLGEGLLATVSVDKVAESHVKVYEEDGSCGRYVCLENQLVHGAPEANQLLSQFNKTVTSSMNQSNDNLELCNRKLSKLLLSRQRRCFYDTYTYLY